MHRPMCMRIWKATCTKKILHAQKRYYMHTVHVYIIFWKFRKCKHNIFKCFDKMDNYYTRPKQFFGVLLFNNLYFYSQFLVKHDM